jgi:membrane protease YdiL (CAAX protease family)
MAVIAGEVLEASGPWRMLAVLQILVSLVIVLIALRRLDAEPLTWALVMAGLETLRAFQKVSAGEWQSLHTVAAIVLWLAVFVCARTAGFRRAWAEGSTDHTAGAGDVRLAASLLLLYAGVFVLLLLPWGDLEVEAMATLFYGGLVVIGVAAGLLAGHGVLRDTLRFRVRVAHLGPTAVALLICLVIDAFLFAWGTGRWWPDFFDLGLPDLTMLVWISLAPGVFEEWLCRGVMWSCLRGRIGQGATILATATLFALMHGLGRGGLNTVAPQLVAGIVFGLLRAKTGSLVPCMLVHALGNLYLWSLVMGAIGW